MNTNTKRHLFLAIISLCSGIIIALSFGQNYLNLWQLPRKILLLTVISLLLLVSACTWAILTLLWKKALTLPTNIKIAVAALALVLGCWFSIQYSSLPDIKHTVEIAATEDAEVRLLEIKAAQGRVAPFYDIEKDRWDESNNSLIANENGASLRYTFTSNQPSDQVKILFATNPSAGSVIIRLDESKEYGLDLHEANPGESLWVQKIKAPFFIIIGIYLLDIFAVIFFSILTTVLFFNIIPPTAIAISKLFKKTIKTITNLPVQYYFIGTGILVTLLAVFRAAQIPYFGNDAQIMVQSAMLWPKGLVEYWGSYLGSRHLSAAYYAFFMNLFGENLDAFSIAISFSFLLSGLSLAGITYLTIRPHWVAFCTSIVLTVLLYIPKDMWNTPLSEGTFMVANNILFLLWIFLFMKFKDKLNHPKSFLITGLVIALVCGLFTSIRPGNIVFLISVVFTIIIYPFLFPPSSKPSNNRIYMWVIIFIAIGATYSLAKAASVNSWYLWIPAEKPHFATSLYLFQKPLTRHAAIDNGPLSKEYFEGSQGWWSKDSNVGHYYRIFNYYYAQTADTEAADEMVLRIGLETFNAKKKEYIFDTIKTMWDYVTFPLLGSIEIKNDPGEDQRLVAWVEGDLKKREELRRNIATAFPDISVPVAETHRVAQLSASPIMAAIRDSVPTILTLVYFPGFIILLSWLAVFVLLLIKERTLFMILFPFNMYSFVSTLTYSFAQSQVTRYVIVYYPIFFLTIFALAIALIKKAIKKPHKQT